LRYLQYAELVLITLVLSSNLFAADAPPACRFDAQSASLVETALTLASDAYAVLETPLPFDKIVVNPTTPAPDARTLTVYVVLDASEGQVNQAGCIVREPPLVDGERLDDISVRGGCLTIARTTPEIQCSSDAVQTFGHSHGQSEGANPALLYVLAHELAHVLQRRPGEYAGRVEPIELELSQQEKLQTLRDSCEPGVARDEEAADRLAVEVLAMLLPRFPYREPIFSAQGSVFWGIDQLNLAATEWRTAAQVREFVSRRDPHTSFVPTEFPTPDDMVSANARKFVCEVLTQEAGTVLYPGRAITHPTLEVRIQRVAEALRPIAASLPKSDGGQQFESIAVLQEQLGDIFSFMYRETGVYLEAVQSAICTRVNSDSPLDGCASGR
jgi:hypothetical protein